MEEQTIWKQMYLCLAGAMADAVDLMEPVPECRPAWARRLDKFPVIRYNPLRI